MNFSENPARNASANVAGGEEKILEFWRKNKIFEKSVEKGEEDFVFYDGPPFATGLPHYGHILASIIKDVIPRYQTMKGKRVPRKWGWDCHGLPVENLIEKELKLKRKKDIEEYGVEKFNKKAEESVLRYADEWKKIIPRIGRWVDMDLDYRTMDTNYTESVWWVFKTLYDKGLIYEGYKSMHVCPRCETTLSNFEVTQNYQEVKDIAVTVKFELEDKPGTYVLAWTTTPWTLPGNVALAVGENIDYVKVKSGDDFFILAKNRLEGIFKDIEYKIEKELKGKDLIGKRYKPLFPAQGGPSSGWDDSKEKWKNAYKIYSADFVTTDEGAGVVHVAPAFGEEDMELGKKEKLPFIQHVTADGKFKKGVENFAGLFVKPKDNPLATDIEILKFLGEKNLVFAKESVKHSYPFCWRCDTPLLNYATSSWFVNVVKIKNDLVKNNQKVRWIPGHLKDGRFGKWLEGAQDWAISRSRYWGAPLPVWECQKCEEKKVVGSIGEIKEEFGGLNRLFLVRHGEAEHNVNKIISSSDNSKFDLTERGVEQIKGVANILKDEKIDLIFSSPFHRTQKTAGIIAEKTGVEVVIDKRIIEINFGEFDGKSNGELLKVCPTKELRAQNAKFGIESGEEIRVRFEDFLKEINKKYQNKNIVVVSHGDPLQIFYGLTQGLNLLESLRSWYPEVGSIKQTYSKPIDLHRPYIDEVELDCSCGGKMKRISEVFDCWFESGSMPYGQAHYPFENEEWFDKNFPAEFIAEGVDQTRGWFYTLLVLSTGLFNKTAYKNVVANGIILAEDGQKMSKRLKNYPDPMYVVDKYGADALRYYLLSSPAVRAENLNFSEKGVDEVSKKIVSKLRNVLSFYEMYENKIKSSDKISRNVLDEWITLRLRKTGFKIKEGLDEYRLDKAICHIAPFVDDLSNWYIRRSRIRFKNGGKDSVLAMNTTRYILEEFSKLVAPFMPFVAEEIFQKVKDSNNESVHLENWPKMKDLSDKENEALREMFCVKDAVAMALNKRLTEKIKVRQPLKELRIKNYELKGKEELLQLIKDEVNVKEIIFDDKIEGEIELDTNITPELKQEGQVRELTRAIQDLRKKAGLTPQDEIELIVETNEEGKEFMSLFMSNIKKVTNTKSIKFSENDNREIKINELKFKIKI